MLHDVAKDAALYEPDGDRYVPTHYCQGPWGPDAQFGGCPSALVATLVDQTPSLVPMQVARLTTDLLRPVPMTPLTADVRVVREGKRIQVVAASLLADGTEVTRATALRVRRTDLGVVGLPDGRAPNPLPTEPRATDDEPFGDNPPGSRLSMEYLFEETGGYYGHPNWMRLRVDVVKGERPLPIARLAFAADTASGAGLRGPVPVSFINADVAINVVREPESEWISVDGRGWISPTGMGQSQATLCDPDGVVAAAQLVRVVNAPAAS